jgi:sulfofructose kinase
MVRGMGLKWSLMSEKFDVVGVGLNATDTLLLVPRFPAFAGKEPFKKEIVSVGGQVASAVVACQRLGLRTKYVGTVGDDPRGSLQMESLREAGVDVADVEVRAGCATQTAYIVIDGTTGERTVLWRREDGLALRPDDVTARWIEGARMVHLDGHDTPAKERVARMARERGIPVSCDVDTVYEGFERVLPNVDYLISSANFPPEWTGETDRFQALRQIQGKYGMKLAAMTLGVRGALAFSDGRFVYSPGFAVDCVDTTGAGDAFHGAFCFGELAGWPLERTMEFANAMAALNSTALGARGHIASRDEAERLIASGERVRDADCESVITSPR